MTTCDRRRPGGHALEASGEGRQARPVELASRPGRGSRSHAGMAPGASGGAAAGHRWGPLGASTTMRRAVQPLAALDVRPGRQLGIRTHRCRRHEPVPGGVVGAQASASHATATGHGSIGRGHPVGGHAVTLDGAPSGPAGRTATARGCASADCTAGTWPGRSGRPRPAG